MVSFKNNLFKLNSQNTQQKKTLNKKCNKNLRNSIKKIKINQKLMIIQPRHCRVKHTQTNKQFK